MATDTFLSEEEIRSLTNKRPRNAQVRALRTMGIEHRVRPDGSVAVLRAHIFKVFDGETAQTKQTQVIQPNWDAI